VSGTLSREISATLQPFTAQQTCPSGLPGAAPLRNFTPLPKRFEKTVRRSTFLTVS
jgi:hypothetical protein